MMRYRKIREANEGPSDTESCRPPGEANRTGGDGEDRLVTAPTMEPVSNV